MNAQLWKKLGPAGSTLLFATFVEFGEAFARPTGETQACANCHYEKSGPMIDIGMSSPQPTPGETVEFTLSLTARSPGALRTGFYVSSNKVGEFSVVDPDFTRLVMPTEIVHAQPKNLEGGKAQFRVAWKAPLTPGVAKFTVWSVTGNTNGTEMDDHHTMTDFQMAFGCDAKSYYPDTDADGFGDMKKPTLACTPPQNLLAEGGDCDDKDPKISPVGVETCNVVDDNCDGTPDEGLGCGLVYTDGDGDGFGDPMAAPIFGAPTGGFSITRDDCNDRNAAVYPGAPEVQNGVDDNCNRLVDDVVAPGNEPAPAPVASGMSPASPSAGRSAEGATCGVAMARTRADGSLVPSAALLIGTLLLRRVRRARDAATSQLSN